MEVILEKKLYGYCPGLDRSVKIANELADTARKEGCVVYADVPLAHNAEVTARLRRKGVILVNHISQIMPRYDYFLVSAHGGSDTKKKELAQRGFRVVDGVCPRVKSVHTRAINDYRNGYNIVIFGKPDHAEVIGLNGCIGNQALILKTLKDADKVKLSKKTSVISQTTYPTDEFNKLVATLRKNNPKIEIVQRNTVCPIVCGRVSLATDYLKKNAIDFVIVVGSPTSSNTKLLATEASKLAPTKMVADYRSIHKKDFMDYNKVLVISGTSAPPEVVERVAKEIISFSK